MQHLYLLALLPPPPLAEEIHQIRLECSKKFDVYKALRPPVHITLYQPFVVEEVFEKQLFRVLEQSTAGLSSFTQKLENFGCFSNKVVFINALKTAELSNLHKAITSIFGKNNVDKSPDKQINKAFSPHITIAYRDVQPDVFTKIWQEYNNQTFKRNYEVDHFSILKHDKVKWSPIKDFSLRSSDDQPPLFYTIIR